MIDWLMFKLGYVPRSKLLTAQMERQEAVAASRAILAAASKSVGVTPMTEALAERLQTLLNDRRDLH